MKRYILISLMGICFLSVGLFLFYKSIPYHDMMNRCRADEKKCLCSANYVRDNLNNKEYNKFIQIIDGNNAGKYIMLNFYNDDKVAKALVDLPIICGLYDDK